jgi:hypothetical protein
MTQSSVQRRARLAAALDSSVDGEFVTLDDMMAVWGVSKGTMVNTIKMIPFFPPQDHVGERNRVYYKRREALAALQKWEHRGDHVNADRQRRLNKIMGITDEEEAGALPIGDMMKASALRAEMEQRMVAQRALVAKADVANTGARVFEIISRLLSNLGTVVDPNGIYPAAVREAADAAGHQRLLRIHAEMKDMLAGNVHDAQPDGDRKARGGSRKPGNARPSGGRGGGMGKPAGHAPAAGRDNDKSVGAKRPVRQRAKRAPG